MQKKVSIITPCLNGEKFISRYLESVLNQTYKNIELIFINDGSTDRTEDIVKSFIPKFEEVGMKLIYIYKENEGQAKALNEGLKIFTGEYLTWPDSDDILMIDSIEKKVNFLELNTEYGMVRTDAIMVKEDNLDYTIANFADRPNKYSEYIFEDLITEKMYICCGCYMARTSAFEDVNPNREIYCSRAGQNWQMLLPITYKYKCGYIDEVLYKYVVRGDSHSHSIKKLKELLNRCDDHQDILIDTINRISMNDEEKSNYINMIEIKYLRKKMYLGAEHKDKEICNTYYKLLKDRNAVINNDKIMLLMTKWTIFKLIIRGGMKAKRVICSIK